MSNTNTGGPAFPTPVQHNDWREDYPGMNLRQYAAIKLKVPDSGTDWLDVMIRESLRDEFAAKAMQSLIAGSFTEIGQEGIEANRQPFQNIEDLMSETSYKYADAMLKACQNENV